MKTKELIKALRYCGNSDEKSCRDCPAVKECHGSIGIPTATIAADRLEALLAENEQLKTNLNDTIAKYKDLEQQKNELQQELEQLKKQDGYTEYAVEVHDEKGFNRPLDVFDSYEKAEAFCDSYDKSELADDEWLSIVFIDYNKDGDEICCGTVD